MQSSSSVYNEFEFKNTKLANQNITAGPHMGQAPMGKGTSLSKMQISHQEIDYLFEKNWSEEERLGRQQQPKLKIERQLGDRLMAPRL